MICAVITEGIVIVVLSLLCMRLYRDVMEMARTMAGMPVLPDSGKSRVISPYKKKDGDTM